MYLIGGVANIYTSDIWAYTFSTKSWKKYEMGKDIDHFSRYGHSCILFKQYLIIYGGARGTNSILKSKEHLSDVKLYSIDKNESVSFNVQSFTDMPEGRRYHASCKIGQGFVIIGGINNSDQA